MSTVPLDPLHFIRVATPQLRVMVGHYQKSLPPDQFLGLISDIQKMFDKYTVVLGEFHPGEERARAAHRLINVPIEQSTQPPTCFKGCGACCHLEVEITEDEGALLAQIVETGFQIDHKRLGIQASRERKSPDWGLMVNEVNRCVFLGDDQACQVYESRPMICRKHNVASDPNECMKVGGNPLPILIPLAEIVLSAALSQPGNPYSSLSKTLSAALKERDKLKLPAIPVSEWIEEQPKDLV